MQYISINKEEWDKRLEELLLSYTIFAAVKNDNGLDYELIRAEDIPKISYNRPKPATPVKSFFLPVRENVTSDRTVEKPRIIIGIPACDVAGLGLPDEIYLDKDFEDSFYRKRRENSILVSSDCFGTEEHCHCLTYDVKPYATAGADVAVIHLDELIILRIINGRGREFAGLFPGAVNLTDNKVITSIDKHHNETELSLMSANKGLPDYMVTGALLSVSDATIWKKYSSKCVSCGACSAICPTCTCFLLIDKPGFEKIKQNDTCQYPGFERVAGGEDPLFELHNRFRNRYMCKYVWKPGKFRSIACTGCGRCIEACIGKINKNELFVELAGQNII